MREHDGILNDLQCLIDHGKCNSISCGQCKLGDMATCDDEADVIAKRLEDWLSSLPEDAVQHITIADLL